ncbi:MAG: hypothetical protein J4F32_04095 [Dehalococcoidia bacterium]|nr:hypothetical protein [Dehalococcoidia bacterium]
MSPARKDYTPSVRPRARREQGQRRLTPNYPDPSEVKHLWVSEGYQNTAPHALVTPSTGRRLRVIRVRVHQLAADGHHFCEVYFGGSVNIGARPGKAVDYLRIPNLGTGETRTWGRGAGPLGEKNEPLSYRFTAAPSTSHKFIIEYTEER